MKEKERERKKTLFLLQQSDFIVDGGNKSQIRLEERERESAYIYMKRHSNQQLKYNANNISTIFF